MAAIIEVRNLSKMYDMAAARHRGETFRELLLRSLASPWRRLRGQADGTQPLWALRDVSFDVPEGTVLGIIGANGAGKSTLLKILSRITDPTEGSVTVRGRIASLLEVGTGFHPELTGRENIYLNGAILGMRKAEIEAKFDEIVEFSGVGQFLDMPVKRFSSGMFVRLGFSVAAHLDPEVLIVDEVLAVGDVAFQRKCLGKMNEVSRGGRTVLFVSHNLAAVERLCQHALVLQKGRLEFEGTAQSAIDLYLRDVGEPETAVESHAADLRNAPGRPSQCRPLLQRLELFTSDGQPLNSSLPIGAGLRAHVYFRLEQPTGDFDVCLGFDSLLGQRILTAHSVFEPRRTRDPRVGEQVYVCEIPSLTLTPGQYKLKVGLNLSNKEVDTVEDAARVRIAQTDYYGTGRVPWNGTVVLEHHWYLQ